MITPVADEVKTGEINLGLISVSSIWKMGTKKGSQLRQKKNFSQPTKLWRIECNQFMSAPFRL